MNRLNSPPVWEEIKGEDLLNFSPARHPSVQDTFVQETTRVVKVRGTIIVSF